MEGTVIGLIPCLGLVFFFLILIFLLFSAVRIVPEDERGVIFRLGQFVGVKGPGLFFMLPFIDRMVKVDLRPETLDMPTQEGISQDNRTVKAKAIIHFRVLDPEKAVRQVDDYRQATSLLAQTTLRQVIGQSELDELLTQPEKVNEQLQRMINRQTEAWGIEVSRVEIKDIETN